MFTTILTILVLSAPVTSAPTTDVSFKPDVSITFTETTQKKADADCARVLKALRSSGRDAVCTVGATSVASAN